MELTPYSDRASVNKIWFVRRSRGDCPVQEYLMQLDRRTLAASVQLFDRTELAGAPHNAERFRHLSGDVYEFKVHRALAVRYLTFAMPVGWVVVSAQSKPKPAALQRAIREAQRLHDEFGGSSHEHY
jgi:hypothetical protein